jgi:hypothetical protein
LRYGGGADALEAEERRADAERTAERARNLERLVIAPLAQALRCERHGDEGGFLEIGRIERIREQQAERAAEAAPVAEFERMQVVAKRIGIGIRCGHARYAPFGAARGTFCAVIVRQPAERTRIRHAREIGTASAAKACDGSARACRADFREKPRADHEAHCAPRFRLAFENRRPLLKSSRLE